MVLKGLLLLFATQAVMVASTGYFFLYPFPVPGRSISGTAIPANSIITTAPTLPLQNFHFQVRNTHDGSYHFGYDAGTWQKKICYFVVFWVRGKTANICTSKWFS